MQSFFELPVNPVIPAKAGIQLRTTDNLELSWIPAFAGMTMF